MKTAVAGDVEEVLKKLLTEGGIDKNRLPAFVASIASLYKAGLRQMRPFPNGIPPVYDGVRVEGILEFGNVEQVVNLVTMDSLIERFHIFPLGIPAVTSLRVAVDIGNVREAGAVGE